MGYYDNVKDNVKDSDDTSKPNFDTLRKAAEESSENDDKKQGDDTDIEILEDGLNKSSGSSSSSGIQEIGGDKSSKSSGSNSSRGSGENAGRNQSSASADISGVEEKLERIIEQNERMIDILESFGS